MSREEYSVLSEGTKIGITLTATAITTIASRMPTSDHVPIVSSSISARKGVSFKAAVENDISLPP